LNVIIFENSQKASRAAKNVLVGHVFETPDLHAITSFANTMAQFFSA